MNQAPSSKKRIIGRIARDIGIFVGLAVIVYVVLEIGLLIFAFVGPCHPLGGILYDFPNEPWACRAVYSGAGSVIIVVVVAGLLTFLIDRTISRHSKPNPLPNGAQWQR